MPRNRTPKRSHAQSANSIPRATRQARRVALACLGEHDHALRAAGRVRRAEHRHAAAPYAGQVAHAFLELVRADVAAAADDDVLLSPGDIEAPFGEVGAIARVHPLAV